MNATYFIKLKSRSNMAREMQILEKTSPSAEQVFHNALKIAKNWGLRNGSEIVEFAVETHAGDCIVPSHSIVIDKG